MEPLNLVQTKKEWLYLFSFLLILLFFSYLFEYSKYRDFISNEVYFSSFEIQNIYPKERYTILKIKSDDIVCFTKYKGDIQFLKKEYINLYLDTRNISFLEYLQGFYTHSFGIERNNSSIKQIKQIQYINSQHNNTQLASIFQALFLAIPLDKHIQEYNSSLGISHLFAISGFHLGIIVGFFYFILNFIYKEIHKKFFPYRNKRYDILIFITLILLYYLYYIGFVPSFLRSFVMFIFALLLLRSNIKIFSYTTLLLVIFIILILFPKLLFSLSFWFSICGVFYIYLYIQYFQNLNKYISILFFNIWIFLAMNPIVHYFFDTTSLHQFLSPLLTLLFVVFYPCMLILHILGLGGIFDDFIIRFFSMNIAIIHITTPIYFFIGYIGLSIGAIFNKYIFYILNIALLYFVGYLYL